MDSGKNKSINNNPEFDAVSSKYQKYLQRGLSLSGENSNYFAQKRVRHMIKFGASDFRCRSIMDFGCGTGGNIESLLKVFEPKKLVAVDISYSSLKIVKETFKDQCVITQSPSSLNPNSNFDFCFSNGVFHHIPPKERKENARTIFESIKPGGHFYFWENNPWNPGTHWVMSRISFDRNAIKIFPSQAVKLLKEVGFKVNLVHYLFIFPRFLAFLRPIEKILKRLPIGCQYLVLAQKV